MSLENKETAGACTFHTEAITRISAKTHRIRWTVENISQIFKKNTDQKINGPDFNFASYRMHLLLLKDVRILMIRLFNKSNEKIDIVTKCVILDCDGSKLCESKERYACFSPEKYTEILSKVFENQEQQFQSLKDDKIIIDCFLKIEGRITTVSKPVQPNITFKEKLLNDLQMIYNNPEDCDITLQVGDDFIYAHKTILSIRSAYFKRMFEKQMKEKVQNFPPITDVSFSTMKKLVEFLYTGNVNKIEDGDIQEIRNLYVAANKYQVMDLRSFCGIKLMSTATVDNIIEVVQLAASHNDEDLKTKAMEFISLYFVAIAKSNTWKTFLSSKAEIAFEIISFCSEKLG